MSALSVTTKFLKENDNLIFTKADKGNTTVVLDRDYLEKMSVLLGDTNTYFAYKYYILIHSK